MMRVKRKKTAIVTICILCVLALLCSCQTTPEEPVVARKDGERLETLLRQSAAPEESSAAPTPEETPGWPYEKEFESGSKLIVEAPLVTHGAVNAPVASAWEKPFVSEECQRITEALYPGAKICYYEITKEALHSDIMEYKQYLHLLQTDPEKYYKETASVGFPLTQEMQEYADKASKNISALTDEELLNILITGLEREYENAPSYADLQESDYQLQEIVDVENSEQMNLMVFRDNELTHLSFVNWKSDIDGSTLILSVEGNNLGGDTIINECVHPDTLQGDAKFPEAKKVADNLVDVLGIDYMEPQWVTSGEDVMGEAFYRLCYTRMINGFPEAHTPDFLGTLAFDPEFEQYQSLWKNEFLEITVKNGAVVRVDWDNPAEITIENDNVKIIPWEEAQEIFLRQMDRLMSPTVSEEDFQIGILGDDREIHITKIELGLAKILMAETNEYKLIPTWNFSGYDKGRLFNNPQRAL